MCPPIFSFKPRCPGTIRERLDEETCRPKGHLTQVSRYNSIIYKVEGQGEKIRIIYFPLSRTI